MLVAIEGVDRSGKSTLTEGLVAALEKKGRMCVSLHSPMRGTGNWGAIVALRTKFEAGGSADLEDEGVDVKWALHLQFLANKYEVQSTVRKALEEHKFVIIDRYVVSGLDYSLMDGIDLVHAHKGLILPACTLYLALPPEVARERDGFGEGFRETPGDHNKASRSFGECIRRFSSDSATKDPLKHPIVSIDATRGSDSVLADAMGILEDFVGSAFC